MMLLRNLWRQRGLRSSSSYRFAAAKGFSESSSSSSSSSSSWPVFDNRNVVMSFIDRGRMMKLRFQSQEEFQMFLEKANAVGATPPDEPNSLTSKLCELDPKRIHVLVDRRIVSRYSQKFAKEKAEQQGCPSDFVTFLDKDYKVDED